MAKVPPALGASVESGSNDFGGTRRPSAHSWSPDDSEQANQDVPEPGLTQKDSMDASPSPSGSRSGRGTRTSRTSGTSKKSRLSSLSKTSFTSSASTLTVNMKRAWNTVRHEDIRIEDLNALHRLYDIKETVGRGSFGVVQLIVHKKSKKMFAMKSVQLNKHINDELAIFQVLEHRYIVRLHNILEDFNADGTRILYFVMDYCEGGDLANWMRQRTESTRASVGGGAVSFYRPPEDWLAAGILWQMLAGIGYLHHHQIIHRDVKLENYLIDNIFTDEDGMCNLKLSDFGLACKFSKGARRTDIAGSLPYMAPEMHRGSYTQACDLFSIGACIYKVVCGDFWFLGEGDLLAPDDESEEESWMRDLILNREADYRQSIWGEHPADFKDIVKSLLEKDDEKRPTARDLVTKNKWLRAYGKTSAEGAGCCCAVQ